MQKLPDAQRTIAAHGFLSLLTRLRRVLLQDCAFLQQKQPEHVLLRHDLFQTDQYKSYAERVIQTNRTAVAPMGVQFKQVMPILHSKMDTISGMMETGLRDLRTTIGEDLSEFRCEINPVMEGLMEVQKKHAQSQRIVTTALSVLAGSLQLVTEGTFETRLRLPEGHERASSAEKSPGNTGAEAGATTSTILTDGLSQVAEMTHMMLNSDSGPPASSIPGTSTSSSSGPPKSSVGTTAEPPGSATPPDTFVLESNYTTVAQLWKEWHQGIFGRKSVVAMARQGYKKSEGQRKLYSRRKLVMDEVARLAAMRVEPESEVVKAMDEYMSLHKLSMTKLQELIKKRLQDGEQLAFWLVRD